MRAREPSVGRPRRDGARPRGRRATRVASGARIPAAFAELFRTEVDWAYHTEPQPGLDGRREYWPRGKAVGGTSAINAMIYVRGHRTDFDRWADVGNDGWAYDDVLPAFKRSERFVGSGGDPAYHGFDGPLSVADQRSPRALSSTFVEAAVEVGYEGNPDFNGARQAGFGFYHVTQQRGRRHSVADAFLTPVLDRPNLAVETGALATRVAFEGDRAVGVDYRQDGRTRRVDADAEVVLSGGTVNSPQLLMLSGVGPADHLEAHDIDVTRDLPGVGRNLQDHLVTGAIYEATTAATLDAADSWRRLPLNLAEFALLGRGPLTSPLGEAGGFASSDGGSSAPDLGVTFVPAHFMNHGFDHPRSGHWFSIGVKQLRPEGRGRITLRSADPTDSPAIDPRYLAEPADVDALVEGFRLVREIAQASAFDADRGAEAWPGADVETDAAIADHIAAKAQTEYHPVGTCRMGHDDAAVVDDRLRDHGLRGLRVVDASVMPWITAGNTNAPTVVIAERAAEFVRGGG